MRYSLAFDFSDFNRRLVAEHKRLLRGVFDKQLDRFTKAVKKQFVAEIRKSQEYRSLVSPQGRLKLDFGLGEQGGDWEGVTDPSTAMLDIIETIIDQVTVTINDKKEGDDFVIGINITLFSNIEAVLNSEGAKYISVNAKGDDFEVPWLEWLLLGGSGPVIVGYHVYYKQAEYSRTGHAIMEPTGSFSVDSRFTGTRRDNFITRAAEGMRQDISELIDKIFLSKI